MRSVAITVLFLLLGAPAAHADELKADYDRLARALRTPPAATVSLRAAKPLTTNSVLARQDTPARRDSVWDGALIGAGVGAGSGYLWAYAQCGTNDSECFMIAGTVGIIGGAAIGAAAGAIIDALHK
jgi:hypothetical protein